MVRRVTTSTIHRSRAGAAIAFTHRMEIIRGTHSRKGGAVFYPDRTSFHPVGTFTIEPL